jgi:hypothetical protein
MSQVSEKPKRFAKVRQRGPHWAALCDACEMFLVATANSGRSDDHGAVTTIAVLLALADLGEKGSLRRRTAEALLELEDMADENAARLLESKQVRH